MTTRKAGNVESTQLIAVLEESVDALELLATMPEPPESSQLDLQTLFAGDVALTLKKHFELETALEKHLKQLKPFSDEPTDRERPETDEQEWNVCDEAIAFSKSLHQVLQTIAVVYPHDKATRDTLRRLTATSIPPAFASFVQAWTKLIIHTEHQLSTSSDQDERLSVTLRERRVRLREAKDDRKQVQFELTKTKEARAAMNHKYSTIIATLTKQLEDTQRIAEQELLSTGRAREQDLHNAHSAFESQKLTVNEKKMTLERTESLVNDKDKQLEDDERKRKQRTATELQELLQRYDTEMFDLDTKLVSVQSELKRIEIATVSLVRHFDRIDEDRRNQLDEQRAIELAERIQRNRDLNFFKFIQRLQALVRGYLVRKERGILAAQQKKKKRSKGKTKKKTSTTTAVTKKKKGSTAISVSPTKKIAPRR